MLTSILLLFILGCCSGAAEAPVGKEGYKWSRVTSAADFPQGYNYPVFVHHGRMVAINDGIWVSEEGSDWKKLSLPAAGPTTAYQRYVQFDGAIYALGAVDGNYEGFTVSTKILRTRDLEKWETVAENSNLPQRIFYGTAVFGGRIWMLGGYDGKNFLNDVWSSSDGAHWTRVTHAAPWSPRTTSVVTVFNDEIWLLGGGVIDGAAEINRKSEREVWATKDGKNWRRVAADLKRKWRGAPVVFDGKLWLVGANRGGGFESAVWMTENGLNWKELSAPWSPRGGVATWVKDETLYVTGGKSSHVENGEVKFVYSNDVWMMRRQRE